LTVAPVSVVVPCFQCKATIQRAVASIEAQSVRPLEIILVDDASGDGTLEVLLEVRQRLGAERVKVIALERNVGAGEARNAGWNAAAGTYVAFLDADDAWHPRKIEFQHAFMRDHPGFAASGHAHSIARADREVDARAPEAGFSSVGRRELLLSNRFITPSAMVRRELPFRFRRGKRYMEDHALWLDLVVAGLPVARLNACLASIFKAPFGEAGLSARVFAMEAGELAMYRDLWRERGISLAAFAALALYSIGKFFRRLLLSLLRPREVRFSWLFPLGYLSVTHSIPALLVVMGMAGRSELAAEIAVIAGATIATFHAFSANTRGLILARSAAVSVREILASRLVLVLPLGLLAVLLATIPAGIPAGLAVVLVLRRAVEWFNEVHLCDAELQANSGFVLGFIGLQAGLFVATAALLGSGSAYAVPVAYVWALAPLAVSLGFIGRALRGPGLRLIGLLPSLLPHIGSTAMMGLSIYAFRLLILLFAEKATAGDLFVAIAIGSFLGTIFANVLGPSFLLEQNRTGITALPLSMRLAMILSLATGLCLAAFATPLSLSVFGLGKTPFFWLSSGLSLVGGVAMVAAQRVRLRILGYDDGRDLFGPDVLTHVLLIAAIPFVVGLWGTRALAAIYLCNAVLAFALYKTSEIAHRRDTASPSGRIWADRMRAAIAFAVFFPVFFQLSGTIYHAAKPMFDSGGVLSSVPLPLSIAACCLGVVTLGDYRRATLGYAFVFALFAMMLLSILVTPASVVLEEKRKFLLLMQCLLPAFGLVVALQADSPAARPALIERSIGAAVAVIVALQLLSTWLHGELALRHDVWLFSVYQHWQYVPVIVCAAYLVALSRLWSDPGMGRVLKAGAPLVAIYALAAVSTVSVVLLILGLGLVATQWILRTRRWGHALPACLAALAIVAYAFAFGDDSAFAYKYPRLASGNMAVRAPCSGLQLARVSRDISPQDASCEIHVRELSTWNWLLISRPYKGSASHALIVEGELREGGLRIGFLQFGVWHVYQDVLAPGAFKLVMPIPAELTTGAFVEAALIYYTPSKQGEVQASIARFTIEPQASAGKPAAAARDADTKPPIESSLPLNFLERFDDWRLFGKPILDSPKTFLFGHDTPVDRSVRTSAHNYYLDVAYLFGVTALLPVLGLVAFTLVMAWRGRRRVAADPALLVLLAVVLFLVLVDSNFKVTLRQPYPGIAAFFLWGLLLSRLRGSAGNRPDGR
jgi:glycosyltransferase involved in cell wall biosynthesis